MCTGKKVLNSLRLVHIKCILLVMEFMNPDKVINDKNLYLLRKTSNLLKFLLCEHNIKGLFQYFLK